jgi:hypothetical protein
MNQRFVCFKFKANVPEPAIENHLRMFAALQEAIPEITNYAAGRAFQGGEGESNFDTAHYVSLQTKEDVNPYFHHSAHQACIEVNKDHWQAVCVFDTEII